MGLPGRSEGPKRPRQFPKWCYVQEVIHAKPRVLESEEFSLKVDDMEPVYLCQMPRTQAEKAETTVPIKSFDEAMEWAGRDLEIVK